MCDADCTQIIFDMRAQLQLLVYMAQIVTACVFGMFLHRLASSR